LGYADKIFRLPLTVLISAMYTGLHPYLAEAATNRQFDDFRNIVQRMVRVTLFVLLPIGLAVVLVREPIVVLVYQRGAFTPAATRATASVLLYLGLLIPTLGLWFVYDRALICIGRTKYLMGFALMSIALKLLGSIALIGPLGLAGLACATVIATLISVVAMHIALNRFLGTKGSLMPEAVVWKIVGAACLAALVTAFVWLWLAGGPHWVTSPAMHTASVLVIMASVYLVLSAALHRAAFSRIWSTLRQYLHRQVGSPA
jgi:putative peptidoglycan lipid II flippase